jgi:hypothetical protein
LPGKAKTEMEQHLLSPPPFTTVQDDAFEEDMAAIVPDEHLRDKVVNSMELAIDRDIRGIAKAFGRAKLPDVETELLITQETGICPALRVTFTIEDEPPKRWLIFHRAGLIGSKVAAALAR